MTAHQPTSLLLRIWAAGTQGGEWRDQRACHDVDPDLFFPEPGIAPCTSSPPLIAGPPQRGDWD